MVILSVTIVVLFTGCGFDSSDGHSQVASTTSSISTGSTGSTGGIDSSTTDNNKQITNSKVITVERGPVIGATVKDANGQIASSVNNSNKYKFDNEPEYPISAEGGFIDIDRNGKQDENEIKLDVVLMAPKGYNIITPLTTLVVEKNESYVTEQLGLSKDDLRKLPSEDKKVFFVCDEIYKKAKVADKGVRDIRDINETDLSGIKSDIEKEDFTRSESPVEYAKEREKNSTEELIQKGKVVPFVKGGFELTIAHVNDQHSNIDEKNMKLKFKDYDKNESYDVEVNVGGYPRLAQKIDEIVKNNKNTLVLNAGDTFQGTLYYSLFNGEADAEMFNTIKWDALTIGNHEFDDGDKHLAEYLSKLNLSSSQILSANIDASKSPDLNGSFSPYTIKTFDDGEKVGIVGLTISGKTKYSSNPSDLIEFKDEVESAQEQINKLKEQGINKVVLLTHVGLDMDKKLAEELDGVDVIIGGDSHSLMGDFSNLGLKAVEDYPLEINGTNGQKVCIGQAWQYNYAVGQMNVIFDENGTVKYCYGSTKLLVDNNFTIDKKEVNATIKEAILKEISGAKNIEIVSKKPEVQTKLKEFADKVDAKKAEVIGTASERLGHNRIPGDKKDGKSDLPLGSDIAPIVAKSFYDLSKLADACIQNAGGVRIAIEKGDITMGDAYTLLPFANTLYEINMTAPEIHRVLEDAVEEAFYGGEDNKTSTGAFPYAYGLRYDINVLADRGSRVTGIEIKDRKTNEWSYLDLNDTEKMYTIVTNSYIAGGKDGYLTFKEVQEQEGREGVDTYLDYAMSFVKYVQAKQAKGEPVSKLPAEDHPIKSFYNGGRVLLYKTDGTFIDKATVGALPDTVKFSHDGKTIITANEGEEREGYNPEGSISIITLDDDNKIKEVKTLGFGDITIPDGVRIKPNTPAPKDLEPEYVAISEDDTKAWVSLQENNAMAHIDLKNQKIIKITPFGKREIKNQKMDISDDDRANPVEGNPANIFALYMPDTIASYNVGGVDYVVTANEGDDRDDADYLKVNELEDNNYTLSLDLKAAILDKVDGKKNPKRELKILTDLGRDGNSSEFTEFYIPGTRSFSIWNGETGELVYDSSSDFEEYIATNLSDNFNTRVKKGSWKGVDATSTKKGVEPEALSLAKVGDKVFAYIGLEKQGGFFVYDITNPNSPTMVQYYNDINYTAAPIEAGDLAPEGSVVFTQDSKNYLAVANELSGTLSVYEIADSNGGLTKLDTLKIGGFDKGAAEIVDYSDQDKNLFVTNEEAKTIDIIDVANPQNLKKVGSIDFSALGKRVQSVSVKNGVVAVAVEVKD